MRFKHLPVLSLEDTTADLEGLDPELTAIETKATATETKVTAVEAKVTTLEAQRGIVEITWPGASPKSNTLTITVVKGAALRPFLTPYKSAVCTTFIPVVESLNETELKVFGFCPEGSPGAGKNKLAWWLV